MTLALTVSLCGCSAIDYRKAVMLYDGGGYEGASKIFEQRGDYKESAAYLENAQKELNYRAAVEAYAEGRFAEAKAAFDGLDGFSGSKSFSERAGHEILANELVGKWESDEIDIIQFVSDFMGENELDYINWDEVGALNIRLILECSDLRTFTVRPDCKDSSGFLASMKELYITETLQSCEDELRSTAA